jgi:hypothetical protein
MPKVKAATAASGMTQQPTERVGNTSKRHAKRIAMTVAAAAAAGEMIDGMLKIL